jgi:hypothetical protein
MRVVAFVLAVAAWPAIGAADPKPAPPPICAGSGDITRVEEVLACPDGGQRFSTPSARDKAGWHRAGSDDQSAFTADETTHMDSYLADGLAHLCSGDTSTDFAYVSLHRKDLGWPMDACRGARFLVIHRGEQMLELRGSPLTHGFEGAEYMIHLHQFDRVMTWKPNAP